MMIFRHIAIAIPLMLGGCGPTPATPTAAILRQPVLETIMKEREIIAQDAQGTFRLLPVSPHTVRFRVWADGMLTVLLDGVALTKGQGGRVPSGSGGGFVVNSYALVGGSRKIFSEIVMKFPDSFAVDTCQAAISIQYDSGSQNVQNASQLDIVLTNPLSSNCPSLPRLASRTFDDGGENSKPNGRATSQIVSRNVVLAGWLFADQPDRNPGLSRPGESEDFHYDILLDDDFLARNYGEVTGIKPTVSSALIPPDHGGVSMPLLDPISPRLDVKSLSLPYQALFTIELNAWHTAPWPAGRGPMPAGWVADPELPYPGNAWPFLPRTTLGVNAGATLQRGDYVIVSGTLWQDELHADFNDPALKCFAAKYKGHAGWLEIHPVDSIRKVDPPAKRKHTEQRRLCAETTTDAFDEYIAPPTPPNNSSVLNSAVLIDSRFTHAAATHSTVVEPFCPDRLHAKAAVPVGGSFKATYLLWWEEGTQPRSACSIPGAFPPVSSPRQQCLNSCRVANAACMDSVARRGGPRPQLCVGELNQCRQSCPP